MMGHTVMCSIFVHRLVFMVTVSNGFMLYIIIEGFFCM